MNRKKLLKKLSAGSCRNLGFKEMANLVYGFGFELVRVSGSHHIFSHPDIPELVNFQEVSGQAKPYQIRQFLRLIERHNLTMAEKE